MFQWSGRVRRNSHLPPPSRCGGRSRPSFPTAAGAAVPRPDDLRIGPHEGVLAPALLLHAVAAIEQLVVLPAVGDDEGGAIDKVAASWTAGAEDPQIVAARRHWTIETSTDITGRQGNTESTGIGAGFVARLVSPHDVLKFYGSYDYATTTSATGVKTKSADATKGGIDYQSFYSEKFGWFIRSELGKDSVAGIDLRSTTDAGASFRLIKTTSQSLVGRLGAGYRFESYPVGPNNNGAVAAGGLSYSYNLNKYASLVTDLRYLPALKDFADYRLIHESAIEVPLAADFWKLRIGVANDYNSRPPGGRENLDTTYYTRLLLKWK
jgi:hypothetical protein